MKIEEIAPAKLAREFQVKKGADGQFYWHARSSNGKTTFQGEGHPDQTKAVRAIKQEMEALGSTLPIRITVVKGTKKEVLNFPAPKSCEAPSHGVALDTVAAEPIKPLRGPVQTSPATSAMINSALAGVVHKPPSGTVAMPASVPTAKVPPSGEITMRNRAAPVEKAPNLPAAVKSLQKSQPAAKKK